MALHISNSVNLVKNIDYILVKASFYKIVKCIDENSSSIHNHGHLQNHAKFTIFYGNLTIKDKYTE